jgi:peptidoglycan/xylan/chitin deacetylase (PgdA/CDA1 family)
VPDFPRILMYHSISDPSLPHAVDRDLFARQIAFLAARGYRGESVTNALSKPSRRSMAITFDDGYADNLLTALPMLRDHGFGATVFVVASFADTGTTPWQHAALTWEQCRELAQAGIEIGAHSRTHPDLTRLSNEELQREVAGSRAHLEDRLMMRVRVFAYPFGYLDTRIVDAVRAAGYEAACAVRLPRGISEDRFTLQRIGITKNDTMVRFRVKLSAPYRALLDARMAGLLNRDRG